MPTDYSTKTATRAAQTNGLPSNTWQNIPDGTQTESDASESTFDSTGIQSFTEDLRLYRFNFTLPTDATLVRMRVSSLVAKYTGSATTVRLTHEFGRYVPATNVFIPRTSPHFFLLTKSYADYPGPWTNPTPAWDEGEVNAEGFGINIRAADMNGGMNSFKVFIDYLEVEAEYTYPDRADDFIPVTATPVDPLPFDDDPPPPPRVFQYEGKMVAEIPTSIADAEGGAYCAASGLWFAAKHLVWIDGVPYGNRYAPRG